MASQDLEALDLRTGGITPQHRLLIWPAAHFWMGFMILKSVGLALPTPVTLYKEY